MARIITVVPLAALLAAALVPSPGRASQTNTLVMGGAAGLAAFGLAAALIGQSGRLHVYPVPPVLVMPAPPDAAPTQMPSASSLHSVR
jgi:hypothetical protein